MLSLLNPTCTKVCCLQLLIAPLSTDTMDMFNCIKRMLTVDQNLREIVAKEASDLLLVPCAFYYQCHEAGENKARMQGFAIFHFFILVLIRYYYDLSY